MGFKSVTENGKRVTYGRAEREGIRFYYNFSEANTVIFKGYKNLTVIKQQQISLLVMWTIVIQEIRKRTRLHHYEPGTSGFAATSDASPLPKGEPASLCLPRCTSRGHPQWNTWEGEREWDRESLTSCMERKEGEWLARDTSLIDMRNR